MRSLLEALGAGALAFYRFNVELLLLFVETIGFILTGALNFRQTLFQMAEIGVNSMPIVMLTVGFSGMVLAFYTATEGIQLGATQYVGGLVALTMFRELAPVIAAVVVAARAGSARRAGSTATSRTTRPGRARTRTRCPTSMASRMLWVMKRQVLR